MNTNKSSSLQHVPASGLRFCMPAAFGRHGAGLGNEFIPWTRAWIAAQVLGAKLVNPAFGRNPRGYGKYFDTSRYDWVFNRLVERLLPKIEFTERDYLEHGGGDVAQAIARFAEGRRLHERTSYVLVTGGMWGGFAHIASARDFVRARLLQSPVTVRNLFRLRQQLDPDKLLVSMHVRLGDFGAAVDPEVYRGKFNLSLPLAWYERIAESLFALFGDSLQLLVVTDGREDQLGALASRYGATTTTGMSDSDCSDLLALASADLTVCSVSSYSMWSAFLSDAPYLWFEPNLQRAAGCYSIWGHEPMQQHEKSHTRAAMRRCADLTESVPRGVPIDMSGRIPPALGARLRDRLKTKQRTSDLLLFGAVPIPTDSNISTAIEAP